jgi:hypothetical protein
MGDWMSRKGNNGCGILVFVCWKCDEHVSFLVAVKVSICMILQLPLWYFVFLPDLPRNFVRKYHLSRFMSAGIASFLLFDWSQNF